MTKPDLYGMSLCMRGKQMNGQKRFFTRVVIWFMLCALIMPNVLAERLLISHKEIKLDHGEQFVLSANAPVVWTSSNGSVVSVLPDGTVYGIAFGQARIYAVSETGKQTAVRVVVEKAVKPTRVLLDDAPKTLSLQDTLTLKAQVLPANANQSIVWSSSNKKIATVSASGIVTPKKEGKVKITARAKARKAVFATVSLTVYDPLKPTTVTIESTKSFMETGETRALKAVVQPALADASVTWKSSKPAIISVDAQGVLTALQPGAATITAQTVRGKLQAKIDITAYSTERSTHVPLRTTKQSATAMKANIRLIDDVYVSALNELNTLAAKGSITAAEVKKRKTILVNAFSMYRFAWNTKSRVPYWTSAYGGKKDFLPGVLYYGLPYIQTGVGGGYTNRRYNVSKAVSGGYFSRRSNGSYLMTTRRQASRYVGNDCSAFVCMSTFAGNGYTLSNSVCYLVTSEMAKSSMFVGISGYDNLRPGDALVLSGSHTVMFLYYTDAAKTKMMIIEQGGGDLTTDMHNTVTCSIVNRSSYSGKYSIRRAKFLSKT